MRSGDESLRPGYAMTNARLAFFLLVLLGLPCLGGAGMPDEGSAQGDRSSTVIDLEDSVHTVGESHPLLRRTDQMVVRFDSEAPASAGLPQRLGDDLQQIRRLAPDLAKFSRQDFQRTGPDEQWGSLRRKMQDIDEKSSVAWTAPVFIHEPSGDYVVITDEILVRLENGVDPDEFLGERGLTDYRRGDSMDAFLVRLSAPGEHALRQCEELGALPEVRWAEPNFHRRLHQTFVPDDELFDMQFHLHNTGQSGGTEGADPDMIGAWEIEPGGDPDLLVAVIDSGIRMDHPDLKIRGNPAEEEDGKDTSGNGYVDDIHGWDFTTPDGGDNDPGATTDQDLHSTAVAGIAAARGDNGIGVAGAAFNAGVMPIRIFEGHTATDAEGVAAALGYASGRARTPQDEDWHGADVVVNAFGSSVPHSAEEEAIEWAGEHGRGGLGTPHFSSTGNGGEDWILSPAVLSADFDNVIAVGSSDHDDVHSGYSQYGPEIDLVATSDNTDPGNGTVTTHNQTDSGYAPIPDHPDYTAHFGGTSSAAPLAGGIGALVISQVPDMTAGHLRTLLRETADQIGPVEYDEDGFHEKYGYGRINAASALEAVTSEVIFEDRFESTDPQ